MVELMVPSWCMKEESDKRRAADARCAQLEVRTKPYGSPLSRSALTRRKSSLNRAVRCPCVAQKVILLHRQSAMASTVARWV